MDKREFAVFAMALKTYYCKENILPNEKAMELWYMQLQDIPYDVAENALNKWVATHKWSPTISEIREAAADIVHGEISDWSEGWEQVLRAIRQIGMYRVDEAMESFDSITRQCVERLGFKNICLSENIAADRANFRTMYENLAERKRKESQIPQNVLQAISSVRDRMQRIEQKGEEG